MSNNSYLTRVQIAKKEQIRNCLKCNKKFTSQWKGNRLCAKCNTHNHTESGCREWSVPRFRKSFG